MYKGLEVVKNSGGGNTQAQLMRRFKPPKIYTYDAFEKLNKLGKLGVLEHEYGHYMYSFFTEEDKKYWKNISQAQDIYVSPYAEQMSKFLKGPEEEFCECCKINLLRELNNVDLDLNDYRETKLKLAKILYNHYNNMVNYIKYRDWRNKRTGKKIDYDNAYGYQCVDLIKLYMRDVLDLQPGYFGGSAINAWYNNSNTFKPELFEKIENTLTFVPKAGDIAFFAPTSNNAYGHTAIVDKGSNIFFVKVLEQNGGSGTGTGKKEYNDQIRIRSYNYIYPKFLGVYRYKGN